MADHAVELNVAGQKCRVVSSADEAELEILASMVEEKLARILPPGRPVTTQAVILAAVALANDVRNERQRADAIAKKATTTLHAMLGRVDAALNDPKLADPKLGDAKPTDAKRSDARVGEAKPRDVRVGRVEVSQLGDADGGEAEVLAKKSRRDANERSDGE